VFIFLLTRGFVHTDFVERLTQQSRLEVLHYATPETKDVLPAGSFLLVNPETSIYSDEGTLLHNQGAYAIPASWVEFMKKKDVFNAQRGEYTTVGRKYMIEGSSYIVFVSDKDLPGQHELDILIKTILLGWMLSLVLSYLAGLYFSGNALKPVQHVVREVNKITKDNLSFRLNVKEGISRPDEIDELILTFNALLARIEAAFIAQKRFVQHASHELKTPLTSIMAEAELAMSRDRSVNEYKRTLDVIAQETDRLVIITQGLLTLARLEEGNMQVQSAHVSITGLIRTIVDTFNRRYPNRTLASSITTLNATIMGFDDLLQIAFLNLLDNAVKYSAGDIVLHVHQKSKTISVCVQDFGIGIPAEELARITSPLFRASNAKDVIGAGLGLSLVDRIVKLHAGELHITSSVAEGTRCEIVLPLAIPTV
jgi:signal transduction histidine kinase